MSFRIIFEFILYHYIMFPFKQIKSSLSHQNLPQTIPLTYPPLMSSQSQMQIRRERINAVPQYDIQPKSTENLTDFREIYSHQPSNGTPLTFNANPNYKNKIKKATRPISRTGNKTLQGPTSQRNQIEDYRPEERGYSHKKLEDFSKTTSTLLNNFSFQANEQYQIIKTDNTPEKIYTLAKNRQQNVKEWTSAYGNQNKSENNQTQTISKTSPKINFVHPVSIQPFHQNLQKRGMVPHQAYLLQDIKNQQETIENFQREVVRLNSEIRELKNSNQHLLRQYDEIAKQLRNRNQKKLDESLVEWQRQQSNKMLAEIEKMEKQLKGKNSLNLFLQQQCNLYTQNYKKQVVECQRLKEEHENQKQKFNSIIFMLKEQLEQRQKTKIDQANMKQFDNQLRKREQEIQNLKKINDLQLAKIEKQQHDIEIDRSEINILLMKLQSLQSKNQQLLAELQQHSKKYQQDLFKEKQSKIEQLMNYQQKLSEKSCELITMEQKWRIAQQQQKQMEADYKQMDLHCKQIEKEKIILEDQIIKLKDQFENKLHQQEKEYKVSEQACKVKEQLIIQYRSKIDSFYGRQKVKQEQIQKLQTKYHDTCQQLEKIQEQKSQLTIKLRQVMYHFNRDEHFQCRKNIQSIQYQLSSIMRQKQQINLELKNLQEQNSQIKFKLQQSNELYEQLKILYQSLSQQNNKLKSSMQIYAQIQLDNSKMIENVSKLRQLEEQNRRLTDTSERYEVIVLQNCLMSEKLQNYKELQLQNSKILEKLQRLNQLQVSNTKLKNQIKQLQLKYQNQNFELSIIKNQLSMHRSTNKQNLQKIQQLEKRNQKLSELIAELEQQKQNNVLLTKQKQKFLSTIKSLQEQRQYSLLNQQLKDENHQNQIKKYINLIEQNQIIYETQLQKQKQCIQTLEKQLSTINNKLQHLEKHQLENENLGERPESKIAIRSLKNLSLSPRKVNSQNDTSFVDYVEVDKEGLLFICELLKIEYVEGGIINRIIEQLQNDLRGWQISKKYAQFYTELLELFGIQQKQDNNETLLSQLKGIKDNLSFLIQKISQEEIKINEANKNVQFLGKQLSKNKMKVNQLKQFNHQLIVLNNNLNEQIIVAYSKLCNQKFQTKLVLNIIEQDSLSIQKQISIVTSEPFFSAKSFKAIGEGINYETLE